MMAGRARECLKALRWSADDVAQELGQPSSDVRAWLEGRAPVPIVVIAWLEALTKAHRSVPAPNLDPAFSGKEPGLARDAPIVLPQQAPRHSAPRRTLQRSRRLPLQLPFRRRRLHDHPPSKGSGHDQQSF